MRVEIYFVKYSVPNMDRFYYLNSPLSTLNSESSALNSCLTNYLSATYSATAATPTAAMTARKMTFFLVNRNCSVPLYT